MTPEDMQERDIVEFTDDNGNTLMLEVMDYFYYNGMRIPATTIRTTTRFISCR